MRGHIYAICINFIFISQIIHVKAHNFIDLSQLDFSSYYNIDHIVIRIQVNDTTIKVTCSQCNGTRAITCQEDELIQLHIHLSKENQQIQIPFNTTCKVSTDFRNVASIENITVNVNTSAMSLSWVEYNKTNRYLVYFITSSTHKSQQISTNRISFDNLSEKTWHQICIASIDNLWRTSKFTCKEVLTDFSITGPVTNIAAISDIDTISVTWNNPQYKHDIPQGYIVHINGTTNICRTIIIHMMAVHISTNDPCPHRQFLNWTHLQDLHIDKLPPYCQFNIDIIPFNKNKPFINKSISIQTKQGESDAVQNLQSSIQGNYLYVSFKEPSSPQGRIIKYYMKISRVQMNICTNTNDVVHESNITTLYDYIHLDVVKRCGRYLIEVSAMNGWSRNGGQGKTASTIFIKSSITRSVSISAHVKFITSNSLMVLLDNIISDDTCNIIGFVIEIKSESVKYNCVTRIITNINCTTFRNMVDKVSQCTTTEWRQFDTRSRKVVSYFNGIFINGGDYQTAIWSITDQLEEVTRVNNKPGEIKDCFTDCYDRYRYYGIRSAGEHGTACTEWQKSDRYRTYGSSLSNICIFTSYDRRPWCPKSKRSYEYCNIPKCSNIKSGTGCVTVTSHKTTSETILINWSTSQYSTSNIGYITLLHNTDHLCEKYHVQMCHNCPSENNLENIVKNLYLSCSVGQVDNTTRYETQFSGLHQDKQYIVYIIPIVNVSMVGEVRNMTIRTAMAKPSVPENISLKSRTLHSIEISWDKSAQFTKYGIPDTYLVMTRRYLDTNVLKIVNSISESALVTELEMCTEYCFGVSSNNKAGGSERSKEHCFYTLAPKLGDVQVHQSRSGYFSSTSLSWTYSSTDECSRIFRVQYQFDNKISTITTDKTEYFMTNLVTNAIYTVRIRAESTMDTVDNQMTGQYSTNMTFYTGVDKPNITYYNQSIDESDKRLQISWGIIEQMRGSMFEFIILLNDSENVCILSIHLTCSLCADHINLKYLSEVKQHDRNQLFNCTKKEITNFDRNNITFSYIINSMDKWTNFSVTIYGSNLMGIHALYRNSTAIKHDPVNMATVCVSIFITSFLVLLIVLAAFVKVKQKPTFLFNIFSRKESSKKSNVSKSNNSIQRNRNTRISIQDFSFKYAKLAADGNGRIIREYEKLINEARNIDKSLLLTTNVAQNPINLAKNRYPNILPYDQYRVELQGESSPNNYINASRIPFKNDPNKIEYIAAQGPLDDTVDHFWQMIWDQNVSCVVMLTRIMEEEDCKCAQYYPINVGQLIFYGKKNQMQVKLAKEEPKESHVERTFMVCNKRTGDRRLIMHFHMDSWFDYAAPDVEKFDKLLFRFHENANTNSSLPVLVHCSAGVGATGTFICIDRIIRELVQGIRDISIYDTVSHLRRYRQLMVHRQVQYNFIYFYINYFLQKYMTTDESEGGVYFNV